MAAVYCSLAELYMTDLCLQPEAESRCEEYVQAALDISPEDYEAYQTMASMRMSQSRVEEAAEAMGRSLELWTAIPFEHPEYPSYEFRLVAARLLIEMGSMDVAQSILESLSVEDDEILEVWYLLALALYSLEKRPAANEALLHAEKVSGTLLHFIIASSSRHWNVRRRLPMLSPSCAKHSERPSNMRVTSSTTLRSRRIRECT